MNGRTESPDVRRACLAVTAEQDGFRSDRALAALLPACGRRGAKALFHAGLVRLNGRRADGSERVKPGDRLECPDPNAPEGAQLLHRTAGPRLTTHHGRHVPRLYEDDVLMVLNKPAEIPIHRNQDGCNRRETLEDVLERAYPGDGGLRIADWGLAPRTDRDSAVEDDELDAERGPRGREIRNPQSAIRNAKAFYFVHRLDMETTGCLLVAKNEAVRDALIRAFQERRVRKAYLAIVVGEVPWERRIVKRPLVYRRGDAAAAPVKRRPDGTPDWVRLKKHGTPALRFIKRGVALEEGDPKGKPCETVFTVAERFRGYTLLRCEPKTGRMHQIRVHLASEGFPLAYDPLYGRRSPLRVREFNLAAADGPEGSRIALNRLPLHALQVGFEHPVTKERMEIEAPLPRDLKEFLRLLRKFRSLSRGPHARDGWGPTRR